MKARPTVESISLGALYAHAFAIACEAEPRYREFAGLMADRGHDDSAELFACLAEFEAEGAFQLAIKSLGVEIPSIDAREYAWLVRDVPAPEAYAFLFRMMTPRLAMEVASRAEIRAKTYFEGVRDHSRSERVRALAAELAGGEQAHIDLLSDALAKLPRPFSVDEYEPGDPTIEQQL